MEIIYGEGISKEGEILSLGVKYNIIEKSGSWFSYGDIKFGQGKDAARAFLKENPDIRDEILTKIKKRLLEN